ncbi:pyridoxamine 5'-phosphate oxidase family protein [Rhodoferax sp.]|uniref:pyridoxamine 5'-phosphate oxidase family protein n=1 Tax=Rhodoferax sp. TaxID=50421 RepID=UPI0025EB1E37|nr:pyridoxamine 5'-phosphate oxidase family protein [Rhodoferax sp.]
MTAAFHAGEVALQQRAGEAQRMAEVGPRVIRSYMPDQHRDFFAQLPFVVLGSVDAQSQPWASVVAAPPGFIRSPDASRLRVDALPAASDPLARHLAEGASIGMLGIEPHTRRRNRVNGRVTALDGSGFGLAVEQSFGNCPKYIQAREPVYAEPVNEGAAIVGTQLDAVALRLVQGADTFFIASAHPGASQEGEHGVDVSHRGGKPGFVRVDQDAAGQQWLTVPDLVGNYFFNTLGNLLLQPQAGLLFIDFETGDLLHLAVRAEIVWDGPELARYPGAQRLLRMQVQQVLRRPAALALRWGAASLSPALDGTGGWAQAGA